MSTQRLVASIAVCALLVGCGRSGDVPQDHNDIPEVGGLPGLEVSRARDWPGYNRDLAGTRFSPLAQIDSGNVAELVLAWSYPLADETVGIAEESTFTPIVVEGVMYAAAADRVVALDPATGDEHWRHTLDEGVPSRRGLTYWDSADGAEARVYLAAGRRLIALDALTGDRATAFGDGGEIEMAAAYAGAPTRFDDLLIVGSGRLPAAIRAFDAHGGNEVWTFAVDDDVATAESDRVAGTAAEAPIALSMTIDVDRERLYAALEIAGSDETGADGEGHDHVLVALDARSGERVWSLTTLQGDLWDYAPPAAPTLLDLALDGGEVPLLVYAAATGYVYIISRETGEPVYGIESRPVPSSDVPGERVSSTQPLPNRPPPVAKVAFAEADLITADETNEVHAANCAALVERSGVIANDGPFTPFAYRAPGAQPVTTVVFPGARGAVGWGGAAADPNLGLVFVNAADIGMLGWVEPAGQEAVDANDGDADAPASDGSEPAAAAATPTLVRQSSPFTAPFENPAPDAEGDEALAWPCQKPPWGRLVAIDTAAGEIAWQAPLGVTDGLPPDKQRTGRPGRGGPIVTAGGLVFIAATDDRRLRAFDSSTGREVWSVTLPLGGYAVPITYMGADGRQYVAITAAGPGGADDAEGPVAAPQLIAFRLP